MWDYTRKAFLPPALSVLTWLVPRFIALAAPAMACGLSLPVTLEFCLPRGVGRRLVLRVFVARELAGLVGREGGERVEGSLALAWRLTRRLLVAKELAGRIVLGSLA